MQFNPPFLAATRFRELKTKTNAKSKTIKTIPKQKTKPSTFIQFGCWNNLNPDRGGLKRVMVALQTEIEKNPVDYILVSGDNYYPDKRVVVDADGAEAKQSLIHSDRLKEGFSLLPQTAPPVPIYMILGNHDLDTNVSDKKSKFVLDGEREPTRSCAILTKEKEAVLEVAPNVRYDFFRAEPMQNNVLVCMLDSNIFSVDAPSYLPCYRAFFKDDPVQPEALSRIDAATSVDEQVRIIRDMVRAQLMAAIDENPGIKHLIISGHQPITGIKTKTKKGKVKSERLNDIPYFMTLLEAVYSRLGADVNYYYLCADLHLYQEGIVIIQMDNGVTMHVKQYIIGSGGTELDDETVNEKIKTEEADPNVDYVLESSRRTHGFLKCDASRPERMFRFISVDDAPVNDAADAADATDMDIKVSGRTRRAKSRAMKTTKKGRLIKTHKTHKRREAVPPFQTHALKSRYLNTSSTP